MVKLNKQGRRASMAGGSPMLSLFSPTAAPVEKKKKANRRASITIGYPIIGTATVTTTASTQSTAQTRTTSTSTPPPPSPKPKSTTPSPKTKSTTASPNPKSTTPSPKPKSTTPSSLKVPQPRRPSTPRNNNQFVYEEVEICGMELLRSDSMNTGDSFSYESYARDSFALAGGKGLSAQGAIRSGMHYRTPSECGGPSRRMSNSSSLGIDSADGISPQRPQQPQPQSYQLKNWPAFRRRSSCGGGTSAAAAAGADYNYYYGGQNQHTTTAPRRHQRRASAGSGEERFPGRMFPGTPSVRGASRRGSTGTCDLPGFGAYKARRRASSGAASGVLGYVESPGSAFLNDSLHRRRGSMGSHGRRGSTESYGSYGRRGSMGSYGSYGRKGSTGSYGRRGSLASSGKGSLRSFGSGDKEPNYAGLNDTLHSYGKISVGSYGARGSLGSNDKEALINSLHESYRSGSTSGGGRPRM